MKYPIAISPDVMNAAERVNRPMTISPPPIISMHPSNQVDGRLYAVVSVNAFENVEPELLRRAPSSFEGENEQARLSRRKRNWIAEVQFEAIS
jgi:hypothetical protein